MKRLLLITLLCVFVFAVAAYADNSKRIAEIEDQQKQIIVDIQTLQAQRSQIDQRIAGLHEQFTKLQGAKEELQRQDQKAAQNAK